MLANLNGATRMHFVIGDPVAQTKSPAGVTLALQARGQDAVVVPMQVAPADLDRFLDGASRARNLDSILVTVPHKFAARSWCETVSARAEFLDAVNVMRRNPDGSWHGDMLDGLAQVAALRDAGCELTGRRALLVGAGGAGSAIAHALWEAGVSMLAIHDGDLTRRDSLIARLDSLNGAPVVPGSADPTGFDVVVNASPMGMRADDPLPIQVERLTADMAVGDVITVPVEPPLIVAARRHGCCAVTGTDMFVRVRDLIVDFLLEA